VPVDVAASVLSNTRLSAIYNVVALGAPEVAAAAEPGQFVMIKTSDGCDPLLRRPFSIFEILRDAGGAPIAISLLNKRVGIGTARIFDARPGATLSCLGPLGLPFVAVDPPAEAWMVAGGVGLAPFITLTGALRARGARARLFYGGRTAADLFYVDLFEQLGVEVTLATEDGSRGARGRVTAPLAAALTASVGQPVALYACGPTPMMHAVAALAASAGLPCQVSLEQVMGCGLGGCYSCVVPVRHVDGGDGREPGHPHYVRSCIDGPVFAADRVVWDALHRL
jgi:dihydroorotate dehydrogenase electron transfer subunit